jgi:phosphatidate cytidylyltransferase
MNSVNDVSVPSPTNRLTQSNLAQRLLSSAVLIPVLAVTTWLGGVWFVVLAAAAMVLALYETYQMFTHAGHHPRMIGYGCAGALFAAVVVRPLIVQDLTGLVLFLVVAVSLAAEIPRRERENALLSWSLTLSGALYIGWLMAHFVLLRQLSAPLLFSPLRWLRLDSGAAWIVFAMTITFVSDTTAYVVGRAIGRTRLAPYISPKKSWEGAVGGFAGATIAGALLVPLLGLPVAVGWGAVLGGVGSLAGQIGDLAESLLKRQVGIKDSGHLIPGHGGLLDRADSLLFTVPTLYYLVRWLTT